jgi:N-acetylmuramoyl-L-alanine amidase
MRKVFLSAGHSNNSKPGSDRGASGNGFIEGELTVELRSLIHDELCNLGINAELDKNSNVLRDTIALFRDIITDKCIAIDLHWNAATPQATGTEVLIPKNPSQFEQELASDLAKTISNTLGIRMRGVYNGKPGVKTEDMSARGTLGWMRLKGENILPEISFITNKDDMDRYQKNKNLLAKNMAKVIYDYAKK